VITAFIVVLSLTSCVVGILDVEYDLVQLSFGELELALVCIFLIHRQAFITADIEGFVTGKAHRRSL
jgi:hypothetical protein